MRLSFALPGRRRRSPQVRVAGAVATGKGIAAAQGHRAIPVRRFYFAIAKIRKGGSGNVQRFKPFSANHNLSAEVSDPFVKLLLGLSTRSGDRILLLFQRRSHVLTLAGPPSHAPERSSTRGNRTTWARTLPLLVILLAAAGRRATSAIRRAGGSGRTRQLTKAKMKMDCSKKKIWAARRRAEAARRERERHVRARGRAAAAAAAAAAASKSRYARRTRAGFVGGGGAAAARAAAPATASKLIHIHSPPLTKRFTRTVVVRQQKLKKKNFSHPLAIGKRARELRPRIPVYDAYTRCKPLERERAREREVHTK